MYAHVIQKIEIVENVIARLDRTIQ